MLIKLPTSKQKFCPTNLCNIDLHDQRRLDVGYKRRPNVWWEVHVGPVSIFTCIFMVLLGWVMDGRGLNSTQVCSRENSFFEYTLCACMAHMLV